MRRLFDLCLADVDLGRAGTVVIGVEERCRLLSVSLLKGQYCLLTDAERAVLSFD
ncbi:hypothetical protein Hanom_Chr06g00530631 [Helianthus anomalus]